MGDELFVMGKWFRRRAPTCSAAVDRPASMQRKISHFQFRDRIMERAATSPNRVLQFHRFCAGWASIFVFSGFLKVFEGSGAAYPKSLQELKANSQVLNALLTVL